MLVKVCRKCGKLITYPKAYCDECKKEVDEAREQARAANKKINDREYNKTRDKKYTRFYKEPAWIQLSQSYIAFKRYKCERCKAMAAEVHHKKPIQTQEGWELRYDWENLEALCVICHNKEHNRFKSRKRHLRDEQ